MVYVEVPDILEDVVTISTVLAVVPASRATVWRYVVNGLIPGRKDGSIWLLYRPAVEQVFGVRIEVRDSFLDD